MKGKQILFGEGARAALQRGVDILANAVRVTLGPKGKLVVFKRSTPVFSLDGVTVAKQVDLRDPVENMGAELMKDVARDTDEKAGDGTTTATILGQEIFREGMKAMAAGIDMISMSEGIGEGAEIVKSYVKKTAKQVAGKGDIENVATISSRDPEIGRTVAEILDTLGKEAIVSVEEVKAIGLTSEIVEGYHIPNGFIAPHMMTHPEKGQVILEKPYVLTTMQNIRSMSEILPVLETVAKTESKSLLIIADDLASEALSLVVVNKLRGVLNVAAVRAPGIGDDKDGIMEDIAVAMGGAFVSETVGKKVDEVDLEDLGRADRVVMTAEETIIVGGKGKGIERRVKQIQHLADEEKSDYRKEKILDRLAKLKGKVAVIRVGTISESENMEKRYRIEDAVRSGQSAVKEGIVPGGGMALLRASALVEKAAQKEMDLGKRTGLLILANAIKSPAKQIIENAWKNGDVILDRVLRDGKDDPAYGYNSATGEYGNLIEQGVIDPAMVVRVALENAVSVVSMFLRTDAVIADEPEEKDKEEENK